MLLSRISKNPSKKETQTGLRFNPGIWLLMILVLGGCSMVGPDYVKPTAQEARDWLESEDPKIKSEQADFSQWWTVFNDPILNRLIESAYQQNFTLQNAGIRILEARAQLGIAIGSQYPQTQRATGDAAAQRTSKNVPNARGTERFAYVYDTGFDAAWELDVWGKFRRAVQSEMANLEASIANYDDILVTLTSEVARTYILLRTSEERLAVAQENVKIQDRSLRIAEVRFNAGAVTELDVTQARSLLRGTEASIPQFEIDIRQFKNALAILLGKLPGEIDEMLGEPGLIPKVPAEVAVGIPTELLRRRPDIRFAERQLAAQSALIGFAKADLYPHFSLFGSVGFTTASSTGNRSRNAGLSEMFDSSSFNYSIGPGVSWDLFNYGRITNRVRAADARFQELVANYENTVIEAAQEAEDSMVSFLRSQEAVKFLADAVMASRRSVDLSMIQYREGLVDFQRVLDTQRFLTAQQDALVTTAGDVDLSLVALYKSLGGGWEFRKGKDFVPENIREQMQNRTNWGNLLNPEDLETVPGEELNNLFNWPDW
ncbi:MAG: efflux transporter outer membrane subunit [Deltaproteobacteria bacterium]|nr:efflux transporter outer membrane subunit [Deltaproteobacteria bacterium]